MVFFSRSQFFDVLIESIFFFFFKVSYDILRFVEKGSFELYGTILTNKKVFIINQLVSLLNSGLIYYYIFLSIFMLFICILIFIVMKQITITFLFFLLYLFLINVSSR